MSRAALIIFVRAPELGKVKTRIAATLGAEEALRIYQRLLQHTLSITQPLAIEKFVFYAGTIPAQDLWSDAGYARFHQQGSDLGARMREAFRFLFGRQFEKVGIIGSDCYELTTAILEEAFRAVSEDQVVLGPARDGGYYLLGLPGPIPGLFSGIEWSTPHVFRTTKEKALAAGFGVHELALLSDVDEAADVPVILRKEQST